MTAPTPRPAATAPETLQAGQAHHGAGRFADAEAAYLRAREIDPGNADALHLLGILHFQTGRAASAIELIDAAIGRNPAAAPFRYSLGVALQAMGRHADAVAAYRAAAARDPGHVESRFNAGLALREIGDAEGAIAELEAAVALQPRFPDALAALGTAYADIRRYEDALSRIEAALALAPQDPRLHNNAANVLIELLRLDEAAAAARQAARLAPDNPEIQSNLGRCLQAVGDIDGAAAAYAASHALRRRPGAPPAADAGPGEVYDATTRAKLVHDIEQLRYLEEHGIGPNIQGVAELYESVLSELPAAAGDGDLVPLDAAQRARIGHVYNRPLHVADGAAIPGGAINPALDTAAITARYFAEAPGICHFDDFLRPEALAALRRFCLESTVWYDFSHEHGYLGAYRQDGFACPLVLQIAEDLRHALPDIVKGLPVRHLWAYKYGPDMRGIATHADFAAVNVNFWITPDDCNLDPDSGGLVVHKAECPLDWTFEDYNSADKSRVDAFIADRDAGAITVPHRQNRVVMFNSDLFHATDTIRFRPGYENRRINVTILYGDRHYPV